MQLATEEAKNLRERNMFIVLVPNKAIQQKAQEPPKKRDKSAVDEVSASVWVRLKVSCAVLEIEQLLCDLHFYSSARFGIPEIVYSIIVVTYGY